MQPIDYTMKTAGAGDIFAGLQGAQQQQANQLNLSMNRAREARAAEMHPLAMEGAGLQNQAAQQNMEIQRQQAEMQRQQAQAQAARQQAFDEEMGRLAGLGAKATAADFAAASLRFPEYSSAIMGSFETLDESRQRGMVSTLGGAASAIKNGNVDGAVKMMNDYASAAEQAGQADIAATARSLAKIAQTEPDAALSSIGWALHSIDKDAARVVFGEGEGRVQRSELLPGGLTRSADAQGRPVVYDAAGNKLEGQEALDAIRAAEERGVELARETAAGREEGTLTSRAEGIAEVEGAKVAGAQGPKLALDAFEQANKVRSNISNLQGVVRLIDEGAKSGTIERRLPTWNQSTLELRNMSSRLGLDVVSAVTFGALSEGELALAIQVGLPTDLDEPQLRQWALDKIAAQEKLLGYLEEQAQFLARPGNTLDKWLDRVRDGASNPAPVTPPPSGPPPAPTGGRSFESLLGGDR